MDTLMSRVEDIVKERLTSDQKLHYMPETVMTRELMQELDRYACTLYTQTTHLVTC